MPMTLYCCLHHCGACNELIVDICSNYVIRYSLVFSCKKTVLQLLINLNTLYCHSIQLTDHVKYLGIQFIAGRDLSVDITPVRRKCFVASNSMIAQTHGLAEPVRVQLIKSSCLPLLVYCIDALKLKRSVFHELSVCWNNVLDAFSILRNGNRS